MGQAWAFVCPQGHVSLSMRIVENDLGGWYYCQDCDHRFGCYLNKGELDIGIEDKT